MNKVVLVGRLTRDPELRYSQSGENCTARFTLAVDRRGKDAGTDFISCVAWGKVAEWMDKYTKQGIKIGIFGRITTGSYTNREGRKIYTTEVTVEEYPEFMEKKQDQEQKPEQSEDGFMQLPDGVPDELPFK